MNKNDILSRFPDATDDVVKAILDINSADITKALNKQSTEIQGLNEQITLKDTSIQQLTAKGQKDIESLTSKYDKQINDLNSQLQAANSKVIAIDGLTEKINSLNQTIAERDKTIATNAKNYRIKDELRRAGAHNPDVVMPLLNQEKIVEKDGKFEGFSEQIEALKQTDPYLFTSSNSNSNQRGGFDGRQDLTNGAKTPNQIINDNLRNAFYGH